MGDIMLYISQNKSEILLAFRQHLILSVCSIIIGFIISILICYLLVSKQSIIDHIISFFSFLRLIPGVAILILGMPIFGVGFYPTLIVLTVLTIPSILLCTCSGIKNISPSIIESAQSLGLNKKQLFIRVQLPISVPFILLGIRTAAVDVITIATVASLMGAGGLGRYVLTGLLINNMNLTLVGSILITMMAFFSEVIFGLAQKRLEHKYLGER